MKTRSLTLSAASAAVLLAVACQGEGPHTRPPDADPSSLSPTGSPAAAEPLGARSRLLVIGSVFWGRWMQHWADASPLGEGYPFQRLAEFHRDDYDAWIAGLECPTARGPDLSAREQDRLLSFNCKPRFLDDAAQWFTAFGLANNHTDNRGARGLAETRRALTAHGIQPFGDPDPNRLDRLCSVITVPAQVDRSDGSTTEGMLPIALCGYNGVFEVPSDASVSQVARYSRFLPTLAFPHSGLEYVATPDSIKVELAHRLIDQGSDAVFGDHPHWVQPAEAYRGRLIAYSLGNFIFDQQQHAQRTRAASIDVRLEVSDDGHLDEWLALGETCSAQQGDCLDDIRRASIPEMPFTLAYDVVASANPHRVTRPATAGERRRILERLDWADAMAGLRGRQSGVR